MSNGQTPNGRELDDLQAFPILTADAGQVETSRTSVGGASSVGYMAEHALRDILAIRPTTADAESIVAALNNAFSSSVVDGRLTWKWTPRSFTVQADMGEVTGAQASIYTRAKTMLDQSVLLLDALNALRADADTEDVDATRSTVRTYLLELIDELGTPGGPRVQRVDTIFEALLGPPLDPLTNQPIVDPEKIGGLLGIVRDRLGLTRPRVNTIAEEQTLTDFLVLAEHVIALRLSWEAQRSFFSGESNDVFLGTQLVLLGRALAVVAESVHETEFTMDSVFLGPSERQTIPLPFPADSGETSLKIAELFEWIDHFASNEGPRIIREAGKDGVIALVPTLDRLHKLADLTKQIAESDSTNPTPGFHTPRVRRSLAELVEHLDEARTLARQVRRTPGPEPTEIDPPSAPNAQTVRLEVFGRFFQSGATVRLEPSVVTPAQRTSIVRSRRALASRSNGNPRIGNGNPRRSNGNPRISDENPPSTLLPIDAVSTRFVSESLLIATFDLSTAPLGSVWSVVVANPDFAEDVLLDAFTVEGGTTDISEPVVTEIDPPSAPNDEQLRLDVFGADFQSGAEVRLEPGTGNTAAAIVADQTHFVGEGMLIATFANLTLAPPDSLWTVVVANPDGAEAERTDSFTLEAGILPTISSVDPEAAPIDQPLRLDVLGTAFQSGAQVRLEPGTNNNAPAIDADETHFVGEGMVIATFDDLSGAPEGFWDVVVINPDGDAAILEDGFVTLTGTGPGPSTLSEPITLANVSTATSPLQAEAVEFLDAAGARIGRINLRQPTNKPPTFKQSQSLKGLRARFSRRLSDELMTAGNLRSNKWSGFTILKDGARTPVLGSIRVAANDPQALEFTADVGKGLRSGSYVARLSSEDRSGSSIWPLADHDHSGLAGGRCEFRFVITPD